MPRLRKVRIREFTLDSIFYDFRAAEKLCAYVGRDVVPQKNCEVNYYEGFYVRTAWNIIRGPAILFYWPEMSLFSGKYRNRAGGTVFEGVSNTRRRKYLMGGHGVVVNRCRRLLSENLLSIKFKVTANRASAYCDRKLKLNLNSILWLFSILFSFKKNIDHRLSKAGKDRENLTASL